MYLAVDFGTSFSKAATLEFADPVLLQDPNDYGLPSAFYYDQDIGILVGTEALESGQGKMSVNLKPEIKMDLQKETSFTADGRTFTVSEIVSEIYKAVINKAVRIADTRNIPTEIEGFVITVPAKFGYLEKDIIYTSAKNCLGYPLPITGVLKEPVAAAIHYFKTNTGSDEHILVFDLGGGTCDVALVKSVPGKQELFDVVDSAMERLGGRNWDEKITEFLTDEYEKKYNLKLRDNPVYMKKIRDAASVAKERLTDNERTIVRVELGGELRTAVLTQEKFEEITKPLLDQAVKCLMEVYNRNIGKCEISSVICVGGSSKMKQVKNRLEREFPDMDVLVREPEFAVVKGAAWYADMVKSNEIEQLKLIEYADFSYGFKVVYNYGTPSECRRIDNLIMRGSALPAHIENIYYPPADNKECISFEVFEVSSDERVCDLSAPMVKIGEIDIFLPPNTPKSTGMKTNLTLTSDGILEVEVRDANNEKKKASFSVIHKD